MNRRAFFRGLATSVGAAAACAVAVRAPACNLSVADTEISARLAMERARTVAALRVSEGNIKAYAAYFKMARESNEHFIRTMEMMRDAYCDLETAPAIEYIRPAFDAAVSAI